MSVRTSKTRNERFRCHHRLSAATPLERSREDTFFDESVPYSMLWCNLRGSMKGFHYTEQKIKRCKKEEHRSARGVKNETQYKTQQRPIPNRSPAEDGKILATTWRLKPEGCSPSFNGETMLTGNAEKQAIMSTTKAKSDESTLGNRTERTGGGDALTTPPPPCHLSAQ